MAFVGKLVASIDSNTRGWNRGMGTVRKDLGGLAKMGAKLGAVAAPLLTTAALAGAVHRIDGVNQALARSTSIMPDLTAAQKQSLATQARLIGLQEGLATSARDAGAAYQYLFAAGKSLTHTQRELGHVLRFAQAGNFDAALATDLLTDAQSALGMSTKDVVQDEKNLVRLSDVLIRANTLANASAEQFSTSLTTKAGGALRIVGKDVEEGVAVLAAMADQGVKAEEAGTQLGIVLRDLTTKALENHAAFTKNSVAVFDQYGEMRNLADVVGDLEHALDGMSDAQKKATLLSMGFSDKSLGTLQTIIGTSDKIREYEKGLRSAAGMTEIVANNKLTKLEKAMARVTQIGDNLLQVVGADLVEGFADWTAELTRSEDKLKSIGQTMGEMADTAQASWTAWTAFKAVLNQGVASYMDKEASAMERDSLGLFGSGRGAEAAAEMRAQANEWQRQTDKIWQSLDKQNKEPWASEKINKGVAELANAIQEKPEKAFERQMSDLSADLQKGHMTQESFAERRLGLIEELNKAWKDAGTPLQKYQAQHFELVQQLKKGEIDNDAYAKSLERAGKELRAAQRKAGLSSEGLGTRVSAVATSNMQASGLTTSQQFDKLFAPEKAEGLAELRTFADGIKESVKTPQDRFGEFMAELERARTEFPELLNAKDVAAAAEQKRVELFGDAAKTEMKDFVKSVTESVQTPLERFSAEQAKLAEARKSGLSNTAFERATRDNMRDVLDQTKGATFETTRDGRADGVEAIDARSNAALAAIRESIFGGQDPQQEQVKLTKTGVALQRLMVTELQRIARQSGVGPPVASLRSPGRRRNG